MAKPNKAKKKTVKTRRKTVKISGRRINKLGVEKIVKFRFIDDLTSDVMFEAYGKNLKELFANSAEALMSVICQIRKVKPNTKRQIEMEAEDVGELLFDFLQEIIARVDVEEMFFSKFEVEEVTNTTLKVKMWGEPADPSKGETVVKALTYYGYKFEKTEEGYRVRVAMDI